jgi:beta-lactamase regulating signal transducer with metallopeptidase domain
MTTHECLDAIWRSTLAGSGAIVLVLLLRAGVRRWLGAQAAYLLWALVPAAALAILWPAPVRIVAAVVQSTAAPSAHAPGAATLPVIVFDAQPILLYVWILGAAAMLLWFVLQQRSYLASLGRLAPDANGIVHAETDSGCPALIGALRPRIVVPRDFESRFELPERQLILAHERAHLRRGDAQMNALVVILRCLNWFNPLVHFAASRFRSDQELACDAAVIVRNPSARRLYAEAMLKTQIPNTITAPLRLPVGCNWRSDYPLRERIAMLKRPIPGLRTRVLASLGMTSLTLATGYASWAAQPEVTQTQAADDPRVFEIQFVSSVDGTLSSGSPSKTIGPVGGFAEVAADAADKWEARLRPKVLDDGHILLVGKIRLDDGKTVPWAQAEIVDGQEFELSSFVDVIGHTVSVKGTLAIHDRAFNCEQQIEDAMANAWTAFSLDLYRLRQGEDERHFGFTSLNGGSMRVSDGKDGMDLVLSAVGKGFRIAIRNPSSPRTIDVITSPQALGLMKVNFIIRNGDEIQSQPAVLVKENEQAEVSMDSANDAPPIDLVFKVTGVDATEMIAEYCKAGIAGDPAAATQ